jgi:hypothetical protein
MCLYLKVLEHTFYKYSLTKNLNLKELKHLKNTRLKLSSILFLLILQVSLSNFCFTQLRDDIPCKKALKLSKALDQGNHIVCDKDKAVAKFKKLLNNEEIVYFLNKGSLSIKMIVIEKVFDEKKRDNSIELINSFNNFENELIILCYDVSIDYFLNYALFRVFNKKENNKELYDILIKKGGIEPKD